MVVLEGEGSKPSGMTEGTGVSITAQARKKDRQ